MLRQFDLNLRASSSFSDYNEEEFQNVNETKTYSQFKPNSTLKDFEDMQIECS